ncbi:MAG: sigma-70 family RNA polymerase sigma factor [Flavobacteriales bacterium]|nr:sigma-70 family RNA polymerase sigma factor [Flavobacteriales bacterium]
MDRSGAATPEIVLATAVKHTTTSKTWVDGLRRNDTSTIRSIYDAHFPAVRQYVLKNSGTRDDAKDMFQEAMSVLWLAVKDGRFDTNVQEDPGGFLYRVARNKWLDQVRSAAHKHMKVVHDERTLEQTSELPDDLDDRLGRLREIYATLDDRCRTVLDRFYFERKDLATIAAEMGVEEESIRTIKYRCMMKLRAHRLSIAGEEGTAS